MRLTLSHSWFDGDHTNGERLASQVLLRNRFSDFVPDFQYAAMKFTVRAYGELSDQTRANGQDCSATIFGEDNGPINGKLRTIRIVLRKHAE